MMKKLITLIVNGQQQEILVEPQQTLVEALRYTLGLTGTKEGCGNGNCGSCTVIMDGKIVNSCLVFAVEAAGKEIVTIEGVSQGGKLHPLQQAFMDEGALQCGFCTPGFIISGIALLNVNRHPTEEQIRHAFAGNLCRCTGYDKIVRATLKAAAL
jgi:aerobic carbon-monoxide dehydrogenase small subunit